MLKLEVSAKAWAMRETFVISRSAQTDQPTIMVVVTDEKGRAGRGEGCGVAYAGESPATMMADIERVRSVIEQGLDRIALKNILPKGGARCALDAALWDLEAQREGKSVFDIAGVDKPKPVDTAFTIGIRDIAGYEIAAAQRSDHALLKVKLGAGDPLPAVKAVRRGAPRSALIIDPNQAWSVDDVKNYAPALAELGVVLLEQPIPVGAETGLDGYRSPIPLCADELIDGADDLPRARGRFDVVNIKLDKTGGLTTALELARSARDLGFELMVGCMSGSSLSMAPAMVLAQQCAFVDLDGPLLQAEDWPNGLLYDSGIVHPPRADFWGGPR